MSSFTTTYNKQHNMHPTPAVVSSLAGSAMHASPRAHICMLHMQSMKWRTLEYFHGFHFHSIHLARQRHYFLSTMRRSVMQIEGTYAAANHMHAAGMCWDMFSLFTDLSDTTLCACRMPAAFIRLVSRRKQSVDSKRFILLFFSAIHWH